ncbi:MAG: periplasmic heavy metal sensor [Candidatus Eremiobacteraeota bacterium]|nr:periplasmic heavy metal sensor [Candidatus Eremiobacteraeota bacterium]
MLRKLRLWLVLAFLLLGTTIALAQDQARDPVGEALFPPELIMGNQSALGLSEAQRTSMQSAMAEAQKLFAQYQWQLSGAMETLTASLKQPHVDRTKALAELDKVLAIERQVKHTQLGLMIRLKNELTPEQQAKLTKLKASSPPAAPRR